MPFPEDPPTQPTPTRPATFFRFSLLTLLSITTLAGFVSAIVFSKHWHPDERLLLAFWCAGLILGVSVERARGGRGIFFGAMGAVLGSLLAAIIQHRCVPWQIFTSERILVAYYAFIVGAGWTAAAVAIFLNSQATEGLLQRLYADPRWRFRLLATVAGVFVTLVLYQLLRPAPWRPTWEVSAGFDRMAGAPPNFHLNPQGDALLVLRHQPQPIGDQKPTLLHQLSDQGVVSRELPLDWHEWNLAFSPDGKYLAVGRFENFKLLSVKNGEALFTWQLPARNDETIVQLQFDPTSERLWLTTHTARIQRLYVIELNDKPLQRAELVPFAGYLWLDPAGETFIKMFDAQDETGEIVVEVVRRSDERTILRINDLAQLKSPVFSPDAEYIAFGNRVWSLTTKSAKPFAGEVIGLLPQGKAAQFDSDVKQHWTTVAPDWLREMPFVRHSFAKKQRGQLSIVDVADGQQLAVSPPIELLSQAKISANGTVVAAADSNGQIRIWKVPKP